MSEILGFHTCEQEGGYDYVLNNGPFLSENNDRQWLGQGYYFWTDSDFYAHRWGKDSYSSKYFIIKCRISCEENNIFDLVGKVSDQLIFQDFLKVYQSKIDPELNTNPTISTVIKFLRTEEKEKGNVFPFYAVKVKDIPNDGTEYKMLNRHRSGQVFPERHQICFYQDKVGEISYCCIEKEIFYPEKLEV